MPYTFQPWPSFFSDPADIRKLFGKSPLGLDLEFAGNKPTILGLSDGIFHVSVPYESGRDHLVELLKVHPETKIIGHNFIQADFPLLVADGIPLTLNQIDDSILLWWLTNSHLSKSSGKSALEEDAGEKRGRGFNNLWSMSSVHTDFGHWKTCRSPFCVGPCPLCQPYWYNAIDSAAPVIAFPKMMRVARLRGVDKLYPMHKELAMVLGEMQEYGVRIDVPYVYGKDRHPLGTDEGNSLDEEFRREKQDIEDSLPFNPKSPKQIVDYFKKIDISLPDAQENTVREAIDELGPSAPMELIALGDYKELGNGCDRWFEPQYINKDGYLDGYLDLNGFIHPRIAYFTSTARLMSSSPNCQNVSVRRLSRKRCECGCLLSEHVAVQDDNETRHVCTRCECKTKKPASLGKKIRRAFIAPEGWYIVRADLSNAENRVVLHLSGYEIERGVDLHSWVRDMAGLTEDMEFCIREGGARKAAKTLQHGGNIHEGLQLKTREELKTSRIRQEISCGARIVFPEWTFMGKIVTYTGSNLARRAFGSASFDNRKHALEINERYFSRFPGVRDFQKRVSKQCEDESSVRPPNGYVMLSYGDPGDRMKAAQATWQSQPVAHIIKLAMLNSWRRWKRDGLMRPVLSVHDEVVVYCKESVDPKQAMAWLVEDMEVQQPDVPEFTTLTVPAEPSYGPNWRDQTKLTI